MNESNVTTSGQEGVRPGREATTGVHVGAAPAASGSGAAGRVGDQRSRRHRHQSEFRSYYGLPVLNAPVWESRDIAGYLFLGGLAGASAVVGAGAHLTGRRRLALGSKLGAAGAAGLSLVALIHDLGRPERFVNMLRVVKVTSPMNVGSWLLSVFAPATAVAAATELTGVASGVGTVATAAAAATGPAVAAYTAALICNTAVPSWHAGFRHMPFVFVASGASAAAGLGLMAAPLDENAPVQRLALAAGPAETVLSKVMEKEMGMVAEPYHEGKAGTYMKVAEGLTAAGTIGALFSRRSRSAAFAAGAALVLGSACARFGIFHAGVQSAKDPRYTVIPQRERLASSS